MACATNIFHNEYKPPIGLEPEFEHQHKANLQRVRDIMAAIERFCAAQQPVPAEWLEELHRRLPEDIKQYNPEGFPR